MIASLRGTIIFRNEKSIIIEVNNVGYEVFTTQQSFSQSKETPVLAYIFQVIRDDTNDLYGFETIEDLDLFEKLLSVSGIGPKSAIAIMNITSRNDFIRALSTGHVDHFTKITGIGKKTAQKIILELKDSFGILETTSHQSDIVSALESLGYSLQDIRKILPSLDTQQPTEQQIKQALKHLR